MSRCLMAVALAACWSLVLVADEKPAIDEALRQALVEKNEAKILHLIDQGADVNARFSYGNTVLMLAIQDDFPRVVERMIERGADIKAYSDGNYNALKFAVRFGNMEMVKLLVEKGADINEGSPKWGSTALMEAITCGHEEMVKWFLAHGAKVDLKDKEGKTAMHVGADCKRPTIIRLLVDRGATIDPRNNDGMTPLMLGALGASTNVLATTMALLDAKADVNATNKWGGSILMQVSCYGELDVMKLLIERGAKVDAKTNQGDTALTVAVTYDREAAMKNLVAAGARLDTKDECSRTPLRRAVEDDKVKAVRTLLDLGADPNEEISDEQTLLMYARMMGRKEVAEALVKAGARERFFFGPGDKGDIAVSIRILKKNPKLQQAIPVEYTLLNRDKSRYFRYGNTRSNGMVRDACRLEITDPSGKLLENPMGHEMLVWTGPVSFRVIKPQEAYREVTDIHRWGHLTEAGEYRVVGVFAQSDPPVVSAPISLRVAASTPAEITAYIASLQAELSRSQEEDQRVTILRKLIYTRDARIVPTLLDSMYTRDTGVEEQGLTCFVPVSDAVRKMVLEYARTNGVASYSRYLFSHWKVSREEMAPIIEKSLASDKPEILRAGALAAQQFGDDRFTSQLIRIAGDKKSPAHGQAIYALSLNRNDESVAALKALLENPDPAIQQQVREAIRTAYLYRGNSQGRPLLESDFDESFRQKK